jgi:hypothetical protein
MTELPEDHWQVGREVRLVLSRRQVHEGEVISEPGFEPWPNCRGVITKVARKYVTVNFSGEGIHEHDAQYLKDTGRQPSQHGFTSIVYPGDLPLVLPEDTLPSPCCRCGQRHSS